MKYYLEPDNRGLSDEELLADLRSTAASLGKDYVTREEYERIGRLSSATFQKRFGSWSSAHEKAGLKLVRHFNLTHEECITELQRVATNLGSKTVTVQEFNRLGQFSSAVFTRMFGSWIRALSAAGLELSEHYNEPIPNEKLFSNLESMWEALGRQPRTSDFSTALSEYSVDTYKRRFGSLRKSLEAFLEAMEIPASFEHDEVGLIEKSDAPQTKQPVKRHKTSRNVSYKLRFLVMRRDAFKCRFCGRTPASEPGLKLVIDHVVPWSSGGETVIENLQTLCEECNSGKSNLSL